MFLGQVTGRRPCITDVHAFVIVTVVMSDYTHNKTLADLRQYFQQISVYYLAIEDFILEFSVPFQICSVASQFFAVDLQDSM